MIINKSKHFFSLTESNQSNNLRWHLLYKEEDDSFTDQFGVFKCKDYFNDFVAKYRGIDVECYGLNTKNIKLNPEGTWIHLTNLTAPVSLMHNLALISEESICKGLPGISFSQVGPNVLLFIPIEYYASTYIISFLTYTIRIAHVDLKCKTFEELVTTSPTALTDNPFSSYRAKIIAASFKPPHSRWIDIGQQYLATLEQGDYGYDTTIHNNGCYSWSYNLACGITKV